jgi:hypothetical protein
MTVRVTEAWGTPTSNLTLEPKLLIVANWFLSSFDWARTKILKQARTKTIPSMEGRCLIVFMKNLPTGRDADGQEIG